MEARVGQIRRERIWAHAVRPERVSHGDVANQSNWQGVAPEGIKSLAFDCSATRAEVIHQDAILPVPIQEQQHRPRPVLRAQHHDAGDQSPVGRGARVLDSWRQ